MDMRQFILLKGLNCVKAINAIIVLSLQNQNRCLKGTGAKRDVCPGSLESTGGKVPSCPGGVGAYDDNENNNVTYITRLTNISCTINMVRPPRRLQ